MRRLNHTLILITIIAAINLLIAGSVDAQLIKTEIINLGVSEGTIYIVPPASFIFPKTIINQTLANQEITTNFLANDAAHQITVVDEGTGNTFCVDLSLGNLASPDASLPYQDIGILSMNQNPGASVDLAANNNPASANSVSAPLDYTFGGGVTTTAQIPDAAFTTFNGNSSDSNQMVFMERTSAAPNTLGGYSAVPEFRANIPTTTIGETFIGNITITLTTSSSPSISC